MNKINFFDIFNDENISLIENQAIIDDIYLSGYYEEVYINKIIKQTINFNISTEWFK